VCVAHIPLSALLGSNGPHGCRCRPIGLEARFRVSWEEDRVVVYSLRDVALEVFRLGVGPRRRHAVRLNAAGAMCNETLVSNGRVVAASKTRTTWQRRDPHRNPASEKGTGGIFLRIDTCRMEVIVT
jgi:hypothetical protein